MPAGHGRSAAPRAYRAAHRTGRHGTDGIARLRHRREDHRGEEAPAVRDGPTLAAAWW